VESDLFLGLFGEPFPALHRQTHEQLVLDKPLLLPALGGRLGVVIGDGMSIIGEDISELGVYGLTLAHVLASCIVVGVFDFVCDDERGVIVDAGDGRDGVERSDDGYGAAPFACDTGTGDVIADVD